VANYNITAQFEHHTRRITKLLGPNAVYYYAVYLILSALLRDHFIFKIIPMLNPDGVIVGNYRCSLSGRDLNRNYKTILKDAYPSIWHTREMIKRFMNEIELVLYCDFHGHSRKQNVFVYGCENKDLPNERFKKKEYFQQCYQKKMIQQNFHIIHVNSKFKNIKKVPDELSCGLWVL